MTKNLTYNVVYYVRYCFLDTALPLIREMSCKAKLHLLLELSPEMEQGSIFDVTPKGLPSGIVPADPVLKKCFPAGVQTYWQNVASFNLVVHNCRSSIHPITCWIAHKAIQFIRSLKPDIIHLNDVSLRLVWALPELRKTPIVLSIHDPRPHSGEHNWRTDFGRWLTFKRVRRFILHNKALQESFCARYGLSIDIVDVIPFGVLSIFREWIRESVPEDERTVLFFGRLSQYKGLEVLYEAAPLVAQNVPNVRFIVAGRAVQGYCPQQPPVLPNGGLIEIIDRHVHGVELAQLFQQATVVACPYVDATQSGVVLTAYAFHKPVVATTVGGLPEIVVNEVTGRLVPPHHPVALAKALVELLKSPEKRHMMAANIRLLEQNELSWERAAERTLEAYRKVVENYS